MGFDSPCFQESRRLENCRRAGKGGGARSRLNKVSVMRWLSFLGGLPPLGKFVF